MMITEEQRKAIDVNKGNVLVHASFGSGKTFAIVERLKRLINSGVNQRDILALTFTKDAAENMKKRISDYFDGEEVNIQILTFHSFAYRMLKNLYPSKYGNVKIIEGWLESQFISQLMKEYLDKGTDYRVGDLKSFFSYQKANIVDYGEKVIINDETPKFTSNLQNKLSIMYKEYGQMLNNVNKTTFDDFLLDFYKYLIEDDSLVNKIKSTYKYILVDEFQDTSIINFEILKLISDNNLYVVGDVNQSIYSFQQAEVGNILNFDKEFDNVEVINLKHNFRSTKNIIDVCGDLLEYREENSELNKFGRQLCGRKVNGDKVEFRVFNNEKLEAVNIVQDILNRLKQNPQLNYSDFAIISRTNNGLSIFESMLLDEGIPYTTSTGTSFFENKLVQEIMSYLVLSIMSHDDSVRRIINVPNRYISNKDIRAYESEVFMNNETTNDKITLEQFIRDEHNGDGSNFDRFLKDIDKIRRANYHNVGELISKIVGITKLLDIRNTKDDNMSTIRYKEETISTLVDRASGFTSVPKFLKYVSNIIKKYKENNSINKNAIRLTTAHSSKGLEWNTCYVVGVNGKNYPHSMCVTEDKDEELRLLFVALGRAKDNLIVSMGIAQNDNDDDDFFTEQKLLSPFVEHLIKRQGDEVMRNVNDVLYGEEEYSFYYNSK